MIRERHPQFVESFIADEPLVFGCQNPLHDLSSVAVVLAIKLIGREWDY